MKIARTLASLGVLTLVATPVMSQAAQAELMRTAAPVDSSEQMAGSSGILIALGFVAALTAIVVIASDDDDEPASP